MYNFTKFVLAPFMKGWNQPMPVLSFDLHWKLYVGSLSTGVHDFARLFTKFPVVCDTTDWSDFTDGNAKTDAVDSFVVSLCVLLVVAAEKLKLLSFSRPVLLLSGVESGVSVSAATNSQDEELFLSSSVLPVTENVSTPAKESAISNSNVLSLTPPVPFIFSPESMLNSVWLRVASLEPVLIFDVFPAGDHVGGDVNDSSSRLTALRLVIAIATL
jgi:hypothetical protein